MTFTKTSAFFMVLWVTLSYFLTDYVFTKGYEQGYVEGKQRTEMTEQDIFQQCTQWWFDGSEPRAKQAINQYCDRRTK